MEPWLDHVVGGGSIAVERYHLGLITNVASDSCTVYIRATMRHGVGRESQLNFSRSRVNGQLVGGRVPTLGTCIWVGPHSFHGTCCL
jgi:hypothetical protein